MIPTKATEVAELLNTATATLKSLSFRNILVLCLLSIIGCGVYAIIYLLRTENRGLLVELSGRARIVATVDTCVVGKYYQGSQDFFAVTRNYNSGDKANYYIVAILDQLPEQTAELRRICGTLEYETGVLKRHAGTTPPIAPPPPTMLDKTKELLEPIIQQTPNNSK